MRILVVSFLVIFVDQISKLYVKGFSIPFLDFSHKGLSYGSTTSLISNYFSFTFVENPGIAFGLYFGTWFKLAIPLITIIVVLVLIYMLYQSRNQSLLHRLAISLLFGGAIGNLIDRTFYGMFYDYAPLFHGKVVDFINIRFNNYSGNYIFNIADLALLFGLVLFISVVQTKKKKVTDKLVLSTIVENKELS